MTRFRVLISAAVLLAVSVVPGSAKQYFDE